jgi:hypothetical protein
MWFFLGFLFLFFFLFHLLRHPLQCPARLPDLVLGLVALLAVHLGQRRGQPPAGALHTGGGCLQIALQRGGFRAGWRWRLPLPLRFQKQLRRVQNAFPHQP